MGKVKILVSDRTESAANRTRRELFESIVTKILNREGYRVDSVLASDPLQMELNIKGKHLKTGAPLYAVGRYSETTVTERDLQAYYGRYMVRWFENHQYHGVFFILPGFDEMAGKFYRQHIKSNKHVTVFLYEADDVLKSISEISELDNRFLTFEGEAGEELLLYTKKGMFWVTFMTSYGKNTPDKIAFFDGKGAPITDRSVINFIVDLFPLLADFDHILKDKAVLLQPGLFPDADPIAEVSGSAEYFEYPLPVSPKHFVGRTSLFNILDVLTEQILSRRTRDRGIVIEAPLGWGKSSMVLASAAHVQKNGHIAVAVDCRTASSSTFVPCVIDYAALKFESLDGRGRQKDQRQSISAFGDAVQRIFDIDRKLESMNKLMFVFFDQFEHVFFFPEVLRRIKELFLRISGKQTNIVMGFSWDREVVCSGPTCSDHEFDALADNCRKMILPAFSKAETNSLLKRLAKELGEPLTKDLQFFLHKFSQGYPWLLKMLCAHVKIARQSGIPQPAVPGILLGIEELFQQDFQHLSDAERHTLRQIAESIPGQFSTSSETVDPQVIQNLSRRGLIKSTGRVADVSRNILRHYLKAGELPFRIHFLFDTSIGQVMDALKILYDAGGILDIPGFKIRTGMPDHAFYALARDMDLAGLVTFTQGKVCLKLDMSDKDKDLAVVLRNILRRRLSENHSVSKILKVLKTNRMLTMYDISALLEKLSPAITIKKRTWLIHAHMLSQWLDAADLALLDKNNKNLVYFDTESEIRARDLFLPRRRGGETPRVPYACVESIAERLVQSLHGDGIVDWTGLSKNMIFGGLAALEDIGFIQRKASLIKVLPRATAFVARPDRRVQLFAEGALKLRPFFVFIDILNTKQTTGSTLLELGRDLRGRLGAKWQQSTSEAHAKIMLNWARHANLAPGAFKKIRKGPIKGWKKKKDDQLALF